MVCEIENNKLNVLVLNYREKYFNYTALFFLTTEKDQTNNLSTKSTNIMKPTLSNANTPQNARVNIDQPPR